MRLGILGGGQLARMLALAAYPLGIQTLCLDPSPEACASQVAPVITADWHDETALQKLVSAVDVITYETENIPLACAHFAAKTQTLSPSAEVLRIAQDRLQEKTFFQSLHIPTPQFASISSADELHTAAQRLGFPAVLKTTRMGYDGKGQQVLKTPADMSPAWSNLKNSTLILEKFVNFEYEVSLIAVRNRQGEIRFYPLVRNQHQQGILRWSEAPFDQAELQTQAEQYAQRILETLNYVGVLTIEFFYDGQQLIANEMAPRVHNSGHWTIEGAQTSQFENHLRAIFNLPLGSTAVTGFAFMLNGIGCLPAISSCLEIPGVHFHTYGKTPRPNRKIGHITLVDADANQFQQNKKNLCALEPSASQT